MSDLDLITNRIRDAFLELYPDDTVSVVATDDETYEVTVRNAVTFVADIESDDDGHLYFHLPDDDDRIFSILVRYDDLELDGE